MRRELGLCCLGCVIGADEWQLEFYESRSRYES